MDIHILKKLSFSDKEATTYLTLLRVGPRSVRQLAEDMGLNRGSTYDCLKALQEKGLVTLYGKESKQHFVAENPEKLHLVLQEQEQSLAHLDQQLHKYIPELQALYDKGGERPVAKYYSKKDIHRILEDILSTCEASGEHQYDIYSTQGVREQVYDSFPTFSDVRIAKGIAVRVIAIGEGGALRGLDQRKWLTHTTQTTEAITPTYIMIYPGKTAYISLDSRQQPIGVVIENEGVYHTQKMIFNTLWQQLS